jgi:hypothetical protein
MSILLPSAVFEEQYLPGYVFHDDWNGQTFVSEASAAMG